MPDKRLWLGIRLKWQPVKTYRGEGRGTLVCCQNHRLPWLVNKAHITAVIYHFEHRLEFFDAAAVTDLNDSMRPFWRLDRETFSLNAVSELTPWPSAQALYYSFTGEDLTEEYRSIIPINEFISEWRASINPGWWIIDRRGVGIALVNEFITINDGDIHAIELSPSGVSVYKYGLLKGADLADRDRILLLKIEQLDLDRLTKLFSKKDAISIRLAARLYHKTIYKLAIKYELPF
ncbi:MAG: hypothetical protein HGB32_03580 [Geobacteraceae bacterium]|nr:hypothetical protein [Geobacteraceae bacterium]NTW79213.1 hypothetical protein [Geobacteraceae bacterium]